ncbi:hypothetical protein M569_00921, partial [Genlisea aurea]
MEESRAIGGSREKLYGFWKWAIASVLVRMILSYFSHNLRLSARPEVSTPLTSMRRLAEGYWLKQHAMSPYSGSSMYHGSPLLLSALGSFTVKSCLSNHQSILVFITSGCSLVSAFADFIAAILIRETGRLLTASHVRNLTLLGINKIPKETDILPSGDIAGLVYLWNPFTIVSCVGFNTTPIENLFIILSVFGASAGLIPLAAFGWVIASHLSLYPLVLVIPEILLLGFGLDAPPRKYFAQTKPHQDKPSQASDPTRNLHFSWMRAFHFFFWASIWMAYVLMLCGISMKDYGGLHEMFKRTYGFILNINDLSPNIGVLWYLFAEVFDFFRDFFLMVFHANILFVLLPLAIRLNHRPCFLAFVYVTISSMLKSYPSVGDAGLYLSLLSLFVNELAEMKFSFLLFWGYVGVSLLSPVMHNLWIWRGTGNANFYFATAIAYACLQIIVVIESATTMLNYDRSIRK